MDKNKERTPEETALVSQKFLETIATAMVEMKISPRLAVSLFGFYARRVVVAEVEDGADEAGMTAQVFGAFAEGLGMKTVMKELRGAEAEQFMAENERANSDLPLQ